MGQVRFAFVVMACAAGSALGQQALFFTNHQLFTTAAQSAGKQLKGIEDFEESSAALGSKTAFPNSLQNGVPRPTFPNGITATNLIIQTNITPGPAAPLPNPSLNPNALWVNGAGFIGSNSIKIGTDEFLNSLFSSLDLIFTTPKTAIGVDISTFNGFTAGHTGWTIAAFGAGNALLGVHNIVGPTPFEPAKTFVGVVSGVPIARVNVWAHFTAPQPFAVDNIEMWVPGPSGVMVLGMGLLMVGRRRR